MGSGYSVVVPKRLEEKREKCAKTSVPLSFVCPHEYKPFVTYRIIRTPNDSRQVVTYWLLGYMLNIEHRTIIPVQYLIFYRDKS